MPKPAKRIVLGLLIAWAVLPEWPRIPVEGASARDWNPRTFWFEPWGRSGVHKGIDIFARSGTPVRSASYGLVLYRGGDRPRRQGRPGAGAQVAPALLRPSR
ncbi:hypothetical protein CSC33_4941 [Pseudomonas aeruginosa]|nr:hypothetical protein CSC33_4941 [Pseudomonas aeruginosa]